MSRNKKEELPTVKDLVVRGVAMGMTRAEIMRTFRIFPNQLKKWLNNDDFMEEVRKFREQHFEILDIKIIDLYDKALHKLNELLESEDATVQLQAAKSIISSRFQFKPKETKLDIKGTIKKEESSDDVYLEKLKELRVLKGLDPNVIDVESTKKEEE